MRRKDWRAERIRILGVAHQDVIRRWSASELVTDTAKAMLDAIDGHLHDEQADVPERPRALRSEHD